MDEPRSGQLEILDETECVKLLRSHDLGRIAVVDQNVRPLIFPVNYFFDEWLSRFGPRREPSCGSRRALMSVSKSMGGMRTKASAGACWSKALHTTSPTRVERRLDEYASGRSDPRRLDRASTGLASRPTKSPGAGFTMSPR